MIIPELLSLFDEWHAVFAQVRTQRMAVQMAFALLCVLGRNTVSQRITLLGRSLEDWNKFYRLFSRRKWDARDLFAGVLRKSQPWCPGNYLVVAGDDTLVHKTGKHIHNVGYLRDPLSPKFRYNLALGLRYIQLSLLLPLYRNYPGEVNSGLALPIRFSLAAVLRRPKRRKTWTPAEETAFQQAKQSNTLSYYMADIITELREWMNKNGLCKKSLLMVLDNGYCNKTIFSVIKAKIHLIARLRANSRLYLPAELLGAGFTPDEIRKDKTITWQQGQYYFGSAQTMLKYKEVERVVWPGGANLRMLRLIIIAATPYKRRKNAKLQYRQPGYLLTTDMKASTAFLIQSYLDRWQIEVNHRDEKTVIGVGQAQVSTRDAVIREPAFAVATYSMAKLATLRAMGPLRTGNYAELPSWYAGARRPSCEDMLQKVRREAWEHPELLEQYGVKITPEGLVAATRA